MDAKRYECRECGATTVQATGTSPTCRGMATPAGAHPEAPMDAIGPAQDSSKAGVDRG